MNRITSFFRIDEQVFFSMAGLCLIALLVLAFRAGMHHECAPIKITTSAAAYKVDNNIRFTTEPKTGKSFVWNFGDGTGKEEVAAGTVHTYKIPGRYTVSVTIDGNCSDFENILIEDMPLPDRAYFRCSIKAPDTAYLNAMVTFEDTLSASKSWEWRFEDGGSIISHSKKTTYAYSQPGRKKITLKVDGKPDMVMVKYIDIIDKNALEKLENKPKPEIRNTPRVLIIKDKSNEQPIQPVIVPEKPKEEEAKPVPKRAPDLSNEQLGNMLLEVSAGTKNASDFSEYLCGNLNINVKYNGKGMTFTEMCSKLKEIKRKKIKKIEAIPARVASTNCIGYLSVDIDKKGFLHF